MVEALFRTWWASFGIHNVGSTGRAELAKRLQKSCSNAVGLEPNIAAIRKACTEYQRDLERMDAPIMTEEEYYAALARDVEAHGGLTLSGLLEWTIPMVTLTNTHEVPIGPMKVGINSEGNFFAKLLTGAVRKHPHVKAELNGPYVKFCLGGHDFQLKQYLGIGQLRSAIRFCERQLFTYSREGAYAPLESALCPNCEITCEINEAAPIGPVLYDCVVCYGHYCTQCVNTAIGLLCPTCNPPCVMCDNRKPPNQDICYMCDKIYIYHYVIAVRKMPTARTGLSRTQWLDNTFTHGAIWHKINYLLTVYEAPDEFGGVDSVTYRDILTRQHRDISAKFRAFKGLLTDDIRIEAHNASLLAMASAVPASGY
jgi:hypothetical protein